MKNLSSFECDDNKLTGSLPDDLPANLRRLHLAGNRLSGDLPPAMYKCADLSSVILTGNYLSGPISDEIATLNRLRVLRLDENRHTERDRDVITECITAYLPSIVAQKGFRI